MAAPVALPRLRQRRSSLWRNRWCYIFLIPSGLLLIMFSLYPTIMSWYFSFLDWSGFSDSTHFIGLGNYREAVHDHFFWDAFGRSLLFVLVAVPIRLVLSLFVAMVLNNQALKLSSLFRTLFFLPVVTTAAIVGVVMSLMYSPFNGPINDALMNIGVIDKPIDFLGSSGSSLWTVMAVEIWKNFGITMIYWLAALQTVPRVYLEAAAIDGAGRWQQLRHIIAPLLLPFTVIIVLLTANQTLHTFGIVQSMTKGGPFFSSQTMEVYIYQTAFAPDQAGAVPRLGYASAAGCLFGVCIMVLALLQLWAGRRLTQVRTQLQREASA